MPRGWGDEFKDDKPESEKKELKFLINHREELKICWASLQASLIIKYFILSQLLMTFLLK